MLRLAAYTLLMLAGFGGAIVLVGNGSELAGAWLYMLGCGGAIGAIVTVFWH